MNKNLPAQVIVNKTINIRYRVNKKNNRWCYICDKPSILPGHDYFKVWDNRNKDNFRASYCVDCFKLTKYNEIYMKVAKREGLKRLVEIIEGSVEDTKEQSNVHI